MGAEPWQHAAPWDPNPAKSLVRLQSAYLAANYDLPSVIQDHLASAQEGLKSAQAEGDPYGLLDFYRQQVAMLEEINTNGIPADSREQVEILRRIYSGSGGGIGNVLDIVSVSEDGGPMTARPLRPDELRSAFNTQTPPPLADFETIAPLYAILGRGESVCFPVFENGDPTKPAGWYFVGYTVD